MVDRERVVMESVRACAWGMVRVVGGRVVVIVVEMVVGVGVGVVIGLVVVGFVMVG